MNTLNEQRSREIIDQLMSFKAEDATPTTDFTIHREYTLIAHLPDDINQKIQQISKGLQARYPEHYYYEPEQYHLSVVPIPSSIQVNDVITLLTPILKNWRLPIEVRGFAVNRFQSGVVLYPGEETLIPMRAKLRDTLGIPTQAYTDHRSVWEKLLWANVLRFQKQPHPEMLEDIRKHSTELIGNFVLDAFELYDIGTKTLDPSSSTLLHVFNA